jgi:fatty-acyl-CoA synthase
LEHPDVDEVAVVGVPDARWARSSPVSCGFRPARCWTATPLIGHCRAHAPQKTPAHWIEIKDWPLTGSGKIQKFVLRDQLVSGELRDA